MDTNTSKRSNSYTTTDILEKINETQKHTELLIYYLDHIRNYTGLSDNMLEKISQFDDNSKMILIYEFNKVIKSINSLFE